MFHQLFGARRWSDRSAPGLFRDHPLRFLTFAVAALLATALVSLGSSSAGTTGWSRGPSLPSAFDPRWDTAVAYFPPADQVILFGGSPRTPGDTWRNDTWVLHGSGWSQVKAPAGLTPRGGAALAYDPAIGKLVLFGGTGPAWPPLNQTWLWNGSSWSPGPAAPAQMEGRVGAEMAYLPGIGKLVLFAGAGRLPYTDTWFFTGTSWVPGPGSPAAMPIRTFFGMTYDDTLKKIVVAGGSGGSDVWLFDGTSWTSGPSLPAPLAGRERVRLVYDTTLGGDVLFGGIGPDAAHADLWLLRAGNWQQQAQASPSPAARLDGALVWSTKQNAALLVGGFSDLGFGDQGYADSWWFKG